MRRAMTFALLATACAAQATVADRMQVLAEAVTRLEQHVGAGDTAALAAPIDAISTTATALRSADAGLGREVATWLTAIERAAADLRDPEATLEMRRFDLSRLRAACTACHLQSRTDNAGRGLFPNRDNALFGSLDLLARDGSRRADRSGTVVFLEGDFGESSPLPRPPKIFQKGRRFHPPVVVVTAGTKVRFPNNDVVFHNVFSRSTSNPFDLGTYGKGVEREIVLTNPGLVKVHCNIHPHMASSVLVLPHRYAAITLASGFWSIPDVPDGEYTLRVWHPLATVQPREVEVRGGIALPVEITVRESRARVQHTDKHGRKYRSKY